MLAWLHSQNVQEVHLESGPRLNGAWLRSGLVDELLQYQGGLILGPGLPLAELPSATALDGMPRWVLHDVERFDGDLRCR